ncbi:hypothetical protein VQH23_21145 [Pararoseomonas sp. SCSIO 73927]|uniref:hypothetical protein n=1 Tax=Pararoseomonas sp. SCSIO 73927 TaxID=3114537 RepID=UPI0030CDEA3D
MSTLYADLRWTGSVAAMAAALAALGHPEYADEGAPHDPRVAAFGPVETRKVAGRALSFALIRVAEGTELPAPAGIFLEPGSVSEAVTGVFADIPRTLTIRQFLLGMAADGIITEAEALAAASTGAVPGFVQEVFSALPAGASFPAELTWRAMIEVDRDNPLLTLLGAGRGMTEADMDQAFMRWGAL